MKQSELKSYARLLAELGVNVQKGQQVIITADVSDAYFVRLVQEACYKAGASRVTVDWSDDGVTINDYKYADTKTLQEFPKWKQEQWKYKQKNLPAMIYIESSDPDAMKALDQAKQMEVRKVLTPKIWKYRKPMEEHYQWVIAALPGKAWAKKLFPDDTPAKAFDKLWDAIKLTARLDGDPVENWKKHSDELDERCRVLNSMDIKTLVYKNSLGTDFSVDLIPGTIFCAGKGSTREGVEYLPNIPTEECFISPDKNSAEGRVMAALPLSLMGKVLEHFGFVFKEGRVVEIIAENDEDRRMLQDLVSMDEGACMLGEAALVPYSSPIRESGILFFNTLFDENAACHLAVGMGFPEVIKDVEKLTPEEIAAFPINDSVVHTDFMIGTKDLDIKGITRDGKTVQIFENGDWAF